MARPIKETPILYGKDARRFMEQMNNPPKVSIEEVRQARALFQEVNKRSGISCCG